MLPLYGPLMGAQASVAAPRRRGLLDRLADRLVPGDGLSDEDKTNLLRNGLLQAGLLTLATPTGTGSALMGVSRGLLGGLQGVQDGADMMRRDRREDMMWQRQESEYQREQQLRDLAGQFRKPDGSFDMEGYKRAYISMRPEEFVNQRANLSPRMQAIEAAYAAGQLDDASYKRAIEIELDLRPGAAAPTVTYIDSIDPATGAPTKVPVMTRGLDWMGDVPGLGGGAPAPRVPAPQGQPSLDERLAALTQFFPQATLTSGVRSPEKNAEVDGVANSLHMVGRGADFAVPPDQKRQFMAVAKTLGWDAIDEGDHVHVEIPGQPAPAAVSPAPQAAPMPASQGVPPLLARPSSPRLPGGVIQAGATREERISEAADKVAAETAARVAAESAGKRDERSLERDATFRLYETARDGLMQALGSTETGPIVGRLPAFTANQQTAEGAVAAMAPVLKQLFRTAGEGTFTDRDQELLLAMLPTRADNPEAAQAKLANIDAIVRAKLGQQPAPQAGGASSVDALLEKYR